MTATEPLARNVPLEPGQIVGAADDCQWQVLRHVTDGGFSSVYEVLPATAGTTDRYGPASLALKCLWGTPADLTAIGGEAAKLAAVAGHENVLRLVGSFRFDGVEPPHPHYVGLLLELAAEDLRAFADRARPSERAWAAVFEQVAAGLEHIHARRVVHGDIKPTNVLRIEGRFAIADFGVAAPLETTRSAGIGLARTIAFWPPESASQGIVLPDGGRRPPDGGWRATQLGDVWALAVSMHRMLTGRHITPGTTPEQQYELVCLGKYSIDDRLSPGWRQLLADCLAHDPDDRVVAAAGALRRRLAELALADDFLGVPWTDGRPRVVAILDLPPDEPPAGPGIAPIRHTGAGSGTGRLGAVLPIDPAPEPPPWQVATDGQPDPGREGATRQLPAEEATRQLAGEAPTRQLPDGSARPDGREGATRQLPAEAATRQLAEVGGAEMAVWHPAGPGAAPVLVLYLAQDGGRVQGAVLPGAGLLLDAVRHQVDVAIPSLAQQVRDSQRAVVRLVDEHERLRTMTPRLADEGPQTLVVGAGLERTRELTVVVADVTRQRDRLAGERDRLAAHRDELAGERDRLRQQYSDLARRLDRLERDNRRWDREVPQAPAAAYQLLDPPEPARRELPRREPPGREPSRREPGAEPVRVAARPRRRRRWLRRVAMTLLIVAVLGVIAAVAAARLGVGAGDLHRLGDYLGSS